MCVALAPHSFMTWLEHAVTCISHSEPLEHHFQSSYIMQAGQAQSMEHLLTLTFLLSSPRASILQVQA